MYNNWEIIETNNRQDYAKFVKKFHYTKSLARGCNRVFLLKIDGKKAGVAMYGIPVGSRVKAKYGDSTIELKRFCLSKGCVKNTASWFIAKTIKKLNKGTKVISYADQNQGHEGIIYSASNFKYLGETKPTQYGKIVGVKGKIHLRACYQKINGKYTKKAMLFKKAKEQGKAILKYSKPKHIFMYEVR